MTKEFPACNIALITPCPLSDKFPLVRKQLRRISVALQADGSDQAADLSEIDVEAFMSSEQSLVEEKVLVRPGLLGSFAHPIVSSS